MALSDKAIRAVKPGATTLRIADGNGLYLRVQPSGRKTFTFRTRVDGVEAVTTLGEYPGLTLLEARNKAKQLLDRSHKKGSMTLSEAAERWMARHKIVTINEMRWRFTKYVEPELGGKPLDEIHRRDVSTLLQDVAEENGPVIANKCLGDIKQLFAHAAQVGWVEDSPVAVLTRKVIGGSAVPRDRVLSELELRKLLQELRRDDRFAPETRWVLLLSLITGQRSKEVREISANEFDGKVWVIPKHRTKERHSDQPVLLPLVGRMLLRKMFATLGAQPLVMPNQVPARALARIQVGGNKYTPHDLRRTMATKMGDLGVEPYVIEKCLNHKMGGVLDIYNHGEYRPERAKAWRLWCKYLLSLRG